MSPESLTQCHAESLLSDTWNVRMDVWVWTAAATETSILSRRWVAGNHQWQRRDTASANCNNGCHLGASLSLREPTRNGLLPIWCTRRRGRPGSFQREHLFMRAGSCWIWGFSRKSQRFKSSSIRHSEGEHRYAILPYTPHLTPSKEGCPWLCIYYASGTVLASPHSILVRQVTHFSVYRSGIWGSTC